MVIRLVFVEVKNVNLEFKIYQIKRAGQVYRAINHKLRQKLLYYIHSQGKANVALIAEAFQLESSNVSHHIAILRDINILHFERSWRNIYYSINYEMLEQITEVSIRMDPVKFSKKTDVGDYKVDRRKRKFVLKAGALI